MPTIFSFYSVYCIRHFTWCWWQRLSLPCLFSRKLSCRQQLCSSPANTYCSCRPPFSSYESTKRTKRKCLQNLQKLHLKVRKIIFNHHPVHFLSPLPLPLMIIAPHPHQTLAHLMTHKARARMFSSTNGDKEDQSATSVSSANKKYHAYRIKGILH